MRITLGEAKTFLCPYVGSGLTSTNPKVVDAINETVMRLLPKLPAEGTMARFRFWINNGTITMPREIQTLKKVNIDESPVNIFSKWYEFLTFGAGTLESNSACQSDFVDLGDGYCTHSDPYTAYNVLVTPTENETDKKIRIMGLDENGLEVRSDDGPGEEVDISFVMNKYSTHKFSCITGVVKPQTRGYVYLSLYNVDPLLRYNLATYHPDDTNPSFRRYRVTAVCQCREARTNCYLCAYKDTCNAYTNCLNTADTYTPPYTCVALVKLRYIPLTYNTDPLLIQNLPALKSMLQGIKFYDAGDYARGKVYENIAVSLLREQLNDIEPQNNQIDIESQMPMSRVGVM